MHLLTVIHSLAVMTGLGLTAASMAAQAPTALTKPDAQFSEPFTQIRSVRELPSGKVLVSDLRDKVVQLVDFAGGSMSKVGREGQGPGEYALPSTLFAMPNGVTWLHDLMGRRFLAIDPNGKPGESVQMPGGQSGGIVAMGMGGGGSDAKGRLYTQAPPFAPGGPGSGPPGDPPDSTAIMRWDPSSKGIDTVGWIKGPKAQVSGGGGRFQVMIGNSKVFTPQEAWGVAGDGSVARVTPSPYQVIWYDGAGKPAAGQVVAYSPLKVTEADKQLVIEQRKKMRPMMIAIGPGGRPGSPGNIQLPPPEFEDTKPPFTGENAVMVTPEGEVWVLRTRPASDKTPSYDVFDRAGKVSRKVTLNPSSRVIGFGKGTVYVVRTDEDDLQYLERYRR
jgi:hypothetical protein